MSTPIIVMGANGRMGRTICTLVQEDPAFTLAGVVERSEFAAGLAALSCPVSQNVEELLQSLDGKAVVVDFTRGQSGHGPQCGQVRCRSCDRHHRLHQ